MIPPRSVPAWLAATLFALATALSLVWIEWHTTPRPLPPAPAEALEKKLQCVSYAPYRQPGETPFDEGYVAPIERIDADLRLLAQRFQCVRTYSIDQGLDKVPEVARRHGMKVLVGVWIGMEAAKNRIELDRALAIVNRHADVVRALVVGNEVLLRRDQTEAQLRAYLADARSRTKVPITYADVWEFWRQHPAVAADVDFATIHLLPYWEDDPQPIERAIAHVGSIHALMKKELAKPLLIGETGWPNTGRQRNGAVPSLVNQERFFREFLHLAQAQGLQYNLIEAFDQPWKRKLEGTVGGYWGLYDSDARVRVALTGPVAETVDWPTRALALGATIAGAVLFALTALRGGRRAGSVAVLLAAGAFAGVQSSLHWAHALTAYRDLVEWGSGTFTWLAGLLVAWQAATTWGARSMLGHLGRQALLFGAAVISVLIAADPRYRDFPVALILPAVTGLVLAWPATLPVPGDWPRHRLEATARRDLALGFLLALTAVVILLRETVENTEALQWIATVVILGATAWLRGRRSLTSAVG